MKDNKLHKGSDAIHEPDIINGIGTAVLAREDDMNNIICVGAKCDIEEVTMPSLIIPEQYGIISGILALYVIICKYREIISIPMIYCWIDNEESLEHVKNLDVTLIKLKESDVSNNTNIILLQHLFSREMEKYHFMK